MRTYTHAEFILSLCSLYSFCECGYRKRVHSNEARSPNTNWLGAVTKTSTTDAFGKMDFVELEKRRRFYKSKGIRVRCF